MRYFLVVGEASADLHASRLIARISELDPEAVFAFMGGDLMAQAAGRSPLVHYREVAFMGLGSVLRNLGTIRRAGRQVQEALLAFAPDVVIPVDFAGFNYQYILPFVKRHLPTAYVAYYIAPKLWAWKPWRIKQLRRYVDKLLVILPFEAEYFFERGVPTTYVGNPCVDATLDMWASLVTPKAQIALLPGSRRQELRSNLPLMLEAVQSCCHRYCIVIAGAPGLLPSDYAPYLEGRPGIEVVFGQTYQLVQESRVALVTSGTATLEVALLGTPQIVLYRMGGQRLARWVFDHLFPIKYISLVNLILGRGAVVELIGHEVSSSNIAHCLAPLLEDGDARSEQLAITQELRDGLGDERTSDLAAREILDSLAQYRREA